MRLHIRPFEHLRAHVRETTHAQKSQGQAPFTQEGGRGALGAPASRTEGRCSRAQLRQIVTNNSGTCGNSNGALLACTYARPGAQT